MCPHPAASPGWKDRLTWLFFRGFPVGCDMSPVPGWDWRGHSIPWDMSGVWCWWPLAQHCPFLEPWWFSRVKPQSGSCWTGVFCWVVSPRWLGPGSEMLAVSPVSSDEHDFWVCPVPCSSTAFLLSLAACHVPSPALPFPHLQVLFNHAKHSFESLELFAASDRCVHLWPFHPQINEGICQLTEAHEFFCMS